MAPIRSALLLTLALCSLSILDSPPAEAQDLSFNLNKTTLDMSQRSSGSFTVGLSPRRPSADMRVRISVSPSNSGLTIDTDSNTTGNQDTWRFNRWLGGPHVWHGPHTVNVTFDRDNAANVNSFTISLVGITGPNGERNDFEDVTGSVHVPVNLLFMLDKSTLQLTEGGNGTIGVRLGAQPSADMKLSLSVSPSGLRLDADSIATGYQHEMRFNRTRGEGHDWNQYKFVSVITDQDADAQDETFTVSLLGIKGPAMEDNDYVGKTASVTVTVTDDEEEGIDRGDLSLEITEGESETFDVKLNAAPVSGATVRVSSQPGVSVSPSSLSFDSSNYSTAQQVTVTANEDNDGTDGTAIVALVASGGYTASTAKNIVIHDDDGSIDISDDAIELIEGSKSGSLSVTLGAPPASRTTLSVVSKNTAAVRVSPATLTFTSSNYSRAQIVSLAPVSDNDTDDETATVELTAGTGYRATKVTKSITVVDARSGSIIVDNPQQALQVQEGGSATFTVRLGTKPNKNVSISLSKTEDDITLAPTSLSFTASNWSAPQTVTVSAANDDDDTANGSDTLTLSASGGIVAADVVKRIQVIDDDIAGAIDAFDAAGASLSSASTIAVDEGSSSSFAVKLDRKPNAAVDISLSKTNADITLTPSALTFTESNWDVAQSITITADADSDTADDSDTLTLSASGGIIMASNWTATITVKEPPPGTIQAPSRLTVNESGFGILRVSLATTRTPSSAPVTISLANGNDNFALSPTRLSFAASKWSEPQSVIVSHRPGIDDTNAANDTDTITLSASGGITASNATVAVAVEGSLRGAIHTVPPRILDIDEGETGSFQVTLDAPWNETNALDAQASVSIESIENKVSISPTRLIFSATDWDIPQTVTLTSRHDDDFSDEPDIIVLNASGGIDARRGTLLVNVKDDDIPAGSLLVSGGELVIYEGGQGIFGVRLSRKPNDNQDVIVSLSKHSYGITLSSDALIFNSTNWNTSQPVAVGALQDDDIEDESHTITLSVSGGMVSSPRTKRVRVIDDDESGPDPVKSQALAFPALAAQDDASMRVRCNQETECIVHLDCSAQNDGSVFQGRLPGAIPAWGTRTLLAADIEGLIGGSWSGKGRLGCALRSRANISSQVWTRSGDGVLVNNSALIRSIPEHARHRADIESIPSPDEADQSNLRIRCLAPAGSHCTKTLFSCFDDRGKRYEGGVGAIVRLTTRHLQSEEVAAIIGHRWKGMGLSCELRSDHPFTVQVLTRTGGGGALVNNSATGAKP
ncbi:MAG: hypothetical protein ISN28_12925 [Ectothiorhodospiraceae bacterium AqS1]|nr:hypothetical protein [Ectothiorhodospiraceae bacterium AqS1]